MVSHASFLGGAEQSLLELAGALRRQGEFRPLLACPEGPLQTAARALDIDTAIIQTPRVEGRTTAGLLVHAPRWLSVAAALVRLCRGRSDVRLIHANGLKAFIPSILAAHALRVPCILHLRDYPRRKSLTRFLVRRAHAVVAASRFIAEALGPDLAPAVIVIHNGVAPVQTPNPAERNSLRRELGLADDDKLVVLIAQQVPWKRQDLFLEAAAKIAADYPETRFLLVGSNPWGLADDYRSRLFCRAAQPDLAGRVTLWEHRRDVGRILAAAEVLVLPSDNEPFGRVLVEAASMGVPAVVADRGGPAEIVLDALTGLHFRHGDADSLAKAIARLLSEPGLADSMRTRARDHARQFNVNRHAAAVAALYRQVLHEHPSPITQPLSTAAFKDASSATDRHDES